MFRADLFGLLLRAAAKQQAGAGAVEMLIRHSLGGEPFAKQLVFAVLFCPVPCRYKVVAAQAYHASLVEISGDGHSFGFHSNRSDILKKVIDCQTEFFSHAFFAE